MTAVWIAAITLQLASAHMTYLGLFKSNSEFDNVLPLHTDVYIYTLARINQSQCAILCTSEQLCEGFLFNYDTRECRLCRCSLYSIEIITSQIGWKFFNIINGCQEGWAAYDDHCYLYDERFLEWTQARIFCETLGAYLLEIEDQMESDWITEKFLKADTCAKPKFCSTWSGGNDIATENHFIWYHSAASIVFTNWIPGQPNNGRSSNCINIRYYGQWNDASCGARFKFICEKAVQN